MTRSVRINTNYKRCCLNFKKESLLNKLVIIVGHHDIFLNYILSISFERNRIVEDI